MGFSEAQSGAEQLGIIRNKTASVGECRTTTRPHCRRPGCTGNQARADASTGRRVALYRSKWLVLGLEQRISGSINCMRAEAMAGASLPVEFIDGEPDRVRRPRMARPLLSFG